MAGSLKEVEAMAILAVLEYAFSFLFFCADLFLLAFELATGSLLYLIKFPYLITHIKTSKH